MLAIQERPDVPHWTPFGDLTSVPPRPANDNSTEHLPQVVAFTGLAGSGKSTAADYLIARYGYTRVRFAGPLKDMLRAIGLSEEEIEGKLKEVPCATLQGKTPRYAMQTLGTNWARNMLGNEFWVELWYGRAAAVLDKGGRVVCDDCRFPNEAAKVRRLGGDIFRLEGRGGIAGGHESERMDFQADCVIANDGPPEALHKGIEKALGMWG